MARAIAVTTCAFALCTGLVLGGALSGMDDWGIDHVMPALDPHARSSGIVDSNGLWRPFPLHVNWWNKLLDTYNYPASILPLVLVVAITTLVLLRRGRGREALVWLGAWVAVDAVELLGKRLLSRPALHWSNGAHPIHVTPFDNSYPSGHTARSVVLAAVVAYVWPRLRAPAAAWLALVPVALVVSANHVISDVVGGMLLGLAFALAAHAMMRVWTQSPSSWPRWSAASWATRSRSSPTSQDSASSSPTRS